MERMYQEDLSADRQVWEVDPLECPNCGGEMKIISFITEASLQILQSACSAGRLYRKFS